ncbi:MAG: homospermidine synthase [Thermoanaerobaculaceae bacterium]|nr:homospermidine synthase [Thermoanaerobaculaceae bacterium]MDI9621131.1 saccharopine dehydrogenase C-terminal domain-containing protein [Acidobacteriota bacterium]NLH11321.1 homospermidine synthase [Holophagae bacterium]HPW55696.1 saccharopine dehydrogenase C-terminal domain-containing protein [Thermoanaerobaculaceae bacterium]
MTGSVKGLRAAPVFEGRIVMVGCGSIGQAMLPMIGRHLGDVYARMIVLAADEAGRKIAERCGARFIHCNLTPGNYRTILKNYVRAGDLLLNLSIDISSLSLIRFCAERDALYVDTSIEPWPGVFDNPMLELRQRTNFAIRAKLLDLAEELGSDSPTAVVDHGANPGLVSHFVKRALLDLDREMRDGNARPTTREQWAALACELGVTTIQISERDTQASQRPKRQGEFINTWSVDGFIDELMQPAELSFGSFEKRRPKRAREHRPGSGTLFLERPGASTFARSWVPSRGGFQGMLVTHDEVFSIADYLSIRDEHGFVFRPSVMFVYHPCDDAMLSALELEGNGWVAQAAHRRLGADIVEGMDELGVLLAGHERNAYWYGSQLDIAAARQHVPYANATTVQVVAGALAAMMWALRNPRRGVVEPEDLDFDECLAIAEPYLGRLMGEFTDWTPLAGRGKYFPENLDVQDPWQFQNVRSRQWFGE